MAAPGIALEMTLTLDEFLRLLPGAVPGPFEREGQVFRGGDGARGWCLRVTPLPGLRLGVMDLGRLGLDLDFQGYTPEDREAFLSKFRLQFHRGGG